MAGNHVLWKAVDYNREHTSDAVHSLQEHSVVACCRRSCPGLLVDGYMVLQTLLLPKLVATESC